MEAAFGSRPYRRASLILGVALVVLSTGVGSASASDYGTRVRDGTTWYGSEVSIETPTPGEIGATVIVLNRALVQNGVGNSGFAQVGAYYSGSSTHLDGCASSYETVTAFAEWNPNNDPDDTECSLFGPLTEGDNYTFSVYASNNWKFTENGVVELGESLDGMDTGQPSIGTELNDPSGDTEYPGTSSDAEYGSSTAWYIYQAASAGDPVEVVTESNTTLFTPSNGFTVGSVPTPLSITHPATS